MTQGIADTASRITPERFAWRQTGDGVFRRPLGNTELGFYWDSVFNGVALVMNDVEFDTSQEVADRHNVERAWLKMKWRFPMLGAYVEELAAEDGTGEERVEFVLDERRLATIRPGELFFVDAETSDDVTSAIDSLQNGTPKLSNDLICQLWFVRRKDVPGRYRIFTNIAHYITDGMAGATITREFCHELASLSPSSFTHSPLSDKRLDSLLPLEVLSPSMKYSLPRRRWRLAIAKIIYNARQAKLAVSPIIQWI